MPEFYDRRDGSNRDLPDKFKCPSCGGFIPNNESPGAYMGAISRKDGKTELCSNCGTMEALADYYGQSKSVKDRDFTEEDARNQEIYSKNARDFGAFDWDNPTHYADRDTEFLYGKDSGNPLHLYDEKNRTYECPDCGVDGMTGPESRKHKCEGQE